MTKGQGVLDTTVAGGIDVPAEPCGPRPDQPPSAAPFRPLTWDRAYQERELYKAALRLYTKPLFNWHKALCTSHDQKTLYDFARHGLRNIAALHKALVAHRFHFRPGLALHHNFNGKRRTLYIFPWEERLVDLLLYRLLNRRLNSLMSPQSYAYRISGSGVDVCQRRVAAAVAAAPSPAYVLRRDISDYFNSIDHAVLLGQLSGVVAGDDYLSDLLRARIRFEFIDRGELRRAERGIPFGTAIACFFANLHLAELDRAITAVPGVKYFRYADDILVIAPSREAALAAEAAFDGHLTRLKLASKASHEANLRLGGGDEPDAAFRPADRFRFLGLEFTAAGMVRLSRDKGRKLRNLFKYAFRRRQGKFRQIRDPAKRVRLAVELARKVVEDGFRNVAIIDYYLKHVQDEAQLRLLDRWLAEEVLALAFGKGHRKGNFGRIGFAELRALGLPSLVHRRRAILHGHLESSFFVWKNRNGKVRSGMRRPDPGPAERPAAGVFSPCPEAAATQCS